MFKLKNLADKDRLANALLGMKGKIPEIKELEVGVNFIDSPRAMDLVLTTVFAGKKELETYQGHELHKPVLKLAGEICEFSKVVDYEY